MILFRGERQRRGECFTGRLYRFSPNFSVVAGAENCWWDRETTSGGRQVSGALRTCTDGEEESPKKWGGK